MIVVLGLFHSGTSLLTSILGELGVSLGSGLNEFYENDELATLLRQWWAEPEMRTGTRQAERIAGLRRFAHLGAVKHPLLCLDWQAARQAWPGCRLVATERPLEQSIHAAGEAYESGQRKLHKAKAAAPVEFTVRFGDLLQSPRMEVDRIIYRLGLQSTEEQYRAAVALVRQRPEEPEGFNAARP